MVVLGDIFTVGPYVDTCIPVVTPCCVQGSIGIDGIAGISFFTGVVPLLHTKGRHCAAEDGRQVDGPVL